MHALHLGSCLLGPVGVSRFESICWIEVHIGFSRIGNGCNGVGKGGQQVPSRTQLLL